MCKLSSLIILMTAVNTVPVLSKIVPIIDEALEECVTEEDKAGVFDLSGLQVIAEDDTHAFMNGTWKFNKDLRAPWVYIIYTERFDRGEWSVYALNKRIENFCAEMHDPLEPWYGIFKHVPACPALAGTEWTFNMVPLKFPMEFPPNFEGKWRLTTLNEFEVDGVVKRECLRAKFDFVDRAVV